MKVKGTKSSLGANGKLNFFPTENIDVNFDRIMAVTLVRDGNTTEFRYCPMDRNHQYEARIDAEIVYKPTAAKIGMTPGFSATVRLYNAGDDIINLITGRPNNDSSRFNFQNSLSNKCQITIRAGYWDHSVKTADEALKRVPVLFGGFVNSSARYRKGNDIVTELYCHNIRLDIKTSGRDNISDKLKDAIENDHSEKKIMDILRGVFKEVKSNSSTKPEGKRLKKLIEDVIREHAPSTSKKYEPLLGAMQSKSQSEEQGLQNDEVVDVPSNWRYTEDWFAIHFVNRKLTPSALQEYDKLKQYDAALNDEDIFGFTNPKAGVRTEKGVEDMLVTLLSKSTQGIEYLGVTYNRKKAHFYFYVPSQDTSVRALPQDGTSAISVGDIIRIYNFQNFLDVPVIDGRGCFVAKMMFNPECIAGKFLKLEWQSGLNPIGAISSLTEGVALNAQMGFSFPSLQGGLYQAQVAAMLSNNGYLFEGYYRMVNVTHKLSTHGSEWITTVKTAPGTARR